MCTCIDTDVGGNSARLSHTCSWQSLPLPAHFPIWSPSPLSLKGWWFLENWSFLPSFQLISKTGSLVSVLHTLGWLTRKVVWFPRPHLAISWNYRCIPKSGHHVWTAKHWPILILLGLLKTILQGIIQAEPEVQVILLPRPPRKVGLNNHAHQT